MKKRYEHIWECGRMRVFEYDGMVLCHEYRGYPLNEGYTILLVPCKGGFIKNRYPYRRKYISCRDTIRIDHAPRSMPYSVAPEQSILPVRPKVASAQEKWEQIKLI